MILVSEDPETAERSIVVLIDPLLRLLFVDGVVDEERAAKGRQSRDLRVSNAGQEPNEEGEGSVVLADRLCIPASKDPSNSLGRPLVVHGGPSTDLAKVGLAHSTNNPLDQPRFSRAENEVQVRFEFGLRGLREFAAGQDLAHCPMSSVCSSYRRYQTYSKLTGVGSRIADGASLRRLAGEYR